MPGCTGFVTTDLVLFLVGVNQQAEFSLPIPNSPAFVGVSLGFQALVPDPAAGNALGAVMSDAAMAVIGH
jgi:hypothetical protein